MGDAVLLEPFRSPLNHGTMSAPIDPPSIAQDPVSETRMPHRLVPFVLAIAWLCVSCGGASEPGAGGSSGAETSDDDELGEMLDEPQVEHRAGAIESLGITPPPEPWAEMTHEEREMYMVGKVLPVMNELFQREFPERYRAGIGCDTCHGADGASRGFAMPSGHLMPLPAPGSPAAQALATSLPDSLRFMRETVTPAMGTLIGNDAYRCSGCHTSAP